MSANKPYLRANDLIMALGGAQGLYAKLVGMGVQPPSENAIRLWMNRGQVPGGWTASIMTLLGPKIFHYLETSPPPPQKPDDPFDGLL